MMMGRTSPPKHRHDGTSPLPLGMDWSPPPKKWNGRETVWPHDPRTGWSYCVSVPSWIALPKSQSSSSDPVVFYRVQVGVQSPEGITTTRGVLRRFNDFLKLYADLKRAFPKKSLPSAPPKGLLRMRSRALLDERRYSLEGWMTKLLSDIQISRSIVIASFLELEAAARSSCLEANEPSSDADPSASSSSSALVGSLSIRSDYGSDTVYETSELGTSLDRDDNSDPGLEDLKMYEDLTTPIENLVRYGMSNIDEGLLMGESILDQLEGHRKNKALTKFTDNGNVQKDASLSFERVDRLFDAEPSRAVHARRLSSESIGSDSSSIRGSEISNSWTPNMLSEANIDLNSAEGSRAMGGLGSPELQLHNGEQILLPVDQQSKLNQILMFMQRRLVTAKTDMEDMITRLNQESAVKEYLTTRVKDLEVELDTTKQKSKENLQQALSIEKERVTKMQWDMEELRRKSVEMEWSLKSQEDKLRGGSASASSFQEKDELLRELNAAKEQINTLLKQHEVSETKAKSDIKVLVKEVKSLRKSQNELKQQLQQSQLEKSETVQLLKEEREQNADALASRKKLLEDCEILHSQLQECSIKLKEEITTSADSSTMDSFLELLTKSDSQITQAFAEVHSIAEEIDITSEVDDIHSSLKMVDNELRKILADLITNNTKLRRQVNFLVRSALEFNTASHQETGEESPSVGTVLKKIVETWEL
ncbi:hypothetical protein V2J09_013516 [Rumex salicifolius]